MTQELKEGDVITIDVPIPRPPFWRLIALYRWWRHPLHEQRTFTVVRSEQIDVTSLTDDQPKFTDGLHLERRT